MAACAVAGNLLRHSFGNGLLEFLDGIVHVRGFLLVSQRFKKLTTCI